MSRVVFVGSKKAGLNILKRMHSLDLNSLIGVITLDDSNDGRSVLCDFQGFCEAEELNLHICKNRRDFRKTIFSWKPDLCIVAGWYWLIKKRVLDFVPEGFIGIHYSSLPKYRGGAPVVWQMINGEKAIGASVFYLDEGTDSGDLLGTWLVENKATDYVSDILEKLEARSLHWFDKNYLMLLEGKAKATPQDNLETEPTYCTQRLPRDGEIDWGQSAKEIRDFIRAQSTPYPGAFTHFKDKKLLVWGANPVDLTLYGIPGQVAKITKHGVWIVCGDSRAIALDVVQYDGGEKTSAREVLKSLKIRLGKR